MKREHAATELLRTQLLAALDHLHGPRANLIRARVRHARTIQDLWLERTELFQFVAHELSESRAKLILGVTTGHLASTGENF